MKRIESLHKILRKRAKSIRSDIRKSKWDSMPLSMIERDIVFTLDRIRSVEHVQNKQSLNLLENECSINSEMMQMEDRTPRYSPYRFPEREKIQRRLFWLESEKRKMMADHQLRLNDLDTVLLTLLEKHALLKI